MKIFFPFKRNWNSYLDEIEKFSEHTFIYDNYKSYSPDYRIVNIHWPESIFDWEEPSTQQLEILKQEIKKWKQDALIVYTKHDLQRLKGNTRNFTELFQIIEKNTDIFIHLGEYSKKKYNKYYPKATHVVIPHPLYQNSFSQYSKPIARQKLNISQEALVIMAAGSIRNFPERNMVIKSFNRLKEKNRVLISNNMRSEIKFDFRGRVRLKKIFNIRDFVVKRFKNKYLPPRYLFSYNRISNDELALRISASDIILIPRIKILNSGNVFLGLTFEKILVGPATGNIKETLEEFNFPLFDPNSIKSVTMALEQAITIFKTGYDYQNRLMKYCPDKVAHRMDKVFNSAVSSK